MNPSIDVSHLTKEYRLGGLQNLRQLAAALGARMLGRDTPARSRFKSLDDVSFTIQQGEVVGVIGHNGAGKSTLLKILSGIVTPTSGYARVNGRVAPLIEVGAGFVGDLTGRENVYLNGSVLGLKKREIDRIFEEIVDFAEMAQFIDTPVKRYSSGMQIKLAFAVATSIDSEILIVDEVLAVGDLAFQRKCFRRMENLIKRQQRTVLLVSHNIRQVERLCTRALLLRHGCLVIDGPPQQVCEAFFREIDDRARAAFQSNKHVAESDEDFELIDIRTLSDTGAETQIFEVGADIVVCARFKTTGLSIPTFGFGIQTADMVRLATENTEGIVSEGDIPAGTYEVMCRIRSAPMLPGIFSLRFGVTEGAATRTVFYAEDLAVFEMMHSRKRSTTSAVKRDGIIQLSTEWSISRLPAETSETPKNRLSSSGPNRL
jgi:lipopolysaccharide transport system ATP-binding protein